jgi:hypothetical protein
MDEMKKHSNLADNMQVQEAINKAKAAQSQGMAQSDKKGKTG